MKVSLDYPDAIDGEIMKIAEADGHSNRSAVIRKMIAFYLSKMSPFVAFGVQDGIDGSVSNNKTIKEIKG